MSIWQDTNRTQFAPWFTAVLVILGASYWLAFAYIVG